MNLLTNSFTLRSIAITGFIFIGIISLEAKKPHGPIEEAIQNGEANNFVKENCTWRRGHDPNSCPDPEVRVYLYTPGNPKRELDSRESDWLRHDYEPTRENIILIHGYAGGDNTLPISVLRDAYLRNGSYNIFLVDWGALSAAPCYPAAVSNLHPVARCLSRTLTILRNLGLPIQRTTCVGHSLGAHVCGIMANYLLFRMNRIIGLDPAKPLIRPGLVNKLDSGDADFVEVIHTNAGYYGESNRLGHADFCINGGKIQPFCKDKENDQLCSHVWAVCFMAQSIDNDGRDTIAESCSRRCPFGPKIAQRAGVYVPMGQHTPNDVRGSFCFNSSLQPYCPKYQNGHGDDRCCLPPNNADISFKKKNNVSIKSQKDPDRSN
ncbi:PREDICTED: phospholipase A1 member A [Polistes dominula]|uniref:phospholipase A1 n=1 Tax=Polistes dominula TaxID=743375 RepID=A0ABM1IBE0_POLDO|nr:PREDICTED: phospholipase A1 member A [Polistes dominula]